MDTTSSGQFRKTYGKLLRPTIVTANGHPIGVWQPYKGPKEDDWREALGVEPLPADLHGEVTVPMPPLRQQAERDRILRRINKS